MILSTGLSKMYVAFVSCAAPAASAENRTKALCFLMYALHLRGTGITPSGSALDLSLRLPSPKCIRLRRTNTAFPARPTRASIADRRYERLLAHGTLQVVRITAYLHVHSVYQLSGSRSPRLPALSRPAK